MEEEEEEVEKEEEDKSDQESFVDLTPPDYEQSNRSPNWPYPIEENDRIVAAEFAIFPEYLAYVRATSNNPLVRRGAKRIPITWLPVATADEPDPWGLPPVWKKPRSDNENDDNNDEKNDDDETSNPGPGQHDKKTGNSSK